MIIFGKRRSGKAKCSTKPRRVAGSKTKAERRLEGRIDRYSATMRILDRVGKGLGPLASGYHRPGSLQAS